MNWRRRLRDIAVAGGLTGCAAHTVSGGTAATTGSGGASTTTSNGGTVTYSSPPCNANPDPCCPCTTHYGQGGYGGASCVSNTAIHVGDAGISCSDVLACAEAPTQSCCGTLADLAYEELSAACADGGPGPADAGSD